MDGDRLMNIWQKAASLVLSNSCIDVGFRLLSLSL